ncbi:hypothetical protein K432DRAFT_416393 [Lepidopterella palustris CBS 459.81]|uniref:Uncharacterized protein n=1 Tax=Lepidopterella palustris CBS 459.81 TaxID=1314670 RepID=A0A8E2EBC5_9PEZI|nr:hypothetical protein K432DRAFT_416393 [Lepidopterella palustris CBS 459.81]
MADVRSMLRQERAARQQNGKHSKSSIAMPTSALGSKKRKAIDEGFDGRKRTKAQEPHGLPAGFFDGDISQPKEHVAFLPEAQAETEVNQTAADDPIPTVNAIPPTVAASTIPADFFDMPTGQQLTTADEDDEELWAAFERDVATPPPQQHVIPALAAGATIEAAPMSATELAAQAREDQSTQRGRREAEIEAEKEDAARHLEEEFDEMEELEGRVRRLREKREALRKSREQDMMDDVVEVAPQTWKDNAGEESDDEYDEEDWDDWGFRAA